MRQVGYFASSYTQSMEMEIISLKKEVKQEKIF